MPATSAVLEELTAAFTRDVSFANADVWVALFSADPGGTGANEITAGTGVSGRQRATFGTGSDGVDQSNDVVSIVVPADAVIPWAGFWTAQTGGTFLGGYPLVTSPCLATAVNGSEQVVCPAHGRSVNDPVRLFTTPNAQSAVPAPLGADTTYYVLTVLDADTVVLSDAIDGSAVVPTASGGFILNLDQTQTLGPGGGTFVFSVGNIVYRTVS